jgi:hypothetical protein
VIKFASDKPAPLDMFGAIAQAAEDPDIEMNDKPAVDSGASPTVH